MSLDLTGLLAAAIVAAMVLPVLGFDLGDVIFALPLIVLAFVSARCVAAARRHTPRRATWALLATAAGLASGSSLVGLVAAITDNGPTPTFYLASLASIVLVAAVVPLFVAGLRRISRAALVDCALVGLPITAVGAYVLAVPGFVHGDALLTAVAMVDLVALMLVSVAAAASAERGERRVLLWLVAGCAAVFVGDSVMVEATTGRLAAGAVPTALLWTVGGYLVALAAEEERWLVSNEHRSDVSPPVRGGSYVRAVLPLALVLSVPAITLALWLTELLAPWGVILFAGLSAAMLVLALGRQVHLLVEHSRAAERQRELREETARRNEELEALTGLATTMTQTLEENKITAQALQVLHVAAGASSSALHMRAEDGRYKLCAATGEWQTEVAWAGSPTPRESPDRVRWTRGPRAILRLAVRARDHEIGSVTLVRAAVSPFEDRELELLGLLVDELGMAIQNARDYCEKLEQAIRDPLTGLYNRRYLFETLENEVRRSERYGSEASLVIFDVDDFKSINDAHGHAAGDGVLREIAAAVAGSIRPTDSLARIGGEEFALLLPETTQLDALLVAERARAAVSRRRILADRRVSVSGGVASCPADASSRDGLHRRADAALYWSKHNGKDMCSVASEVSSHPAANSDQDGLAAHLYALVVALDEDRLKTRGHSENVAAYTVALAQALGLEPEHIVKLRRAALLHDIGKVAVASEVLLKPSRLTEDEYEQIKLHPEVGAAMLAHAGLTEEAEWVRHHHERLDGDGYPSGLRGAEIPLEARILFITDSFEAMTSDRPYRSGMSVDAALAELADSAGTQFETAIVERLAELVHGGQLPLLCLRAEDLEKGVAIAGANDHAAR